MHKHNILSSKNFSKQIKVDLQTAGVQTLARQDVLRVSSKGQNHQTRNALIGTTVGAAAGLGGGLAADHVIWSHANCTGGPLFHCGYPAIPHWGIIGTPIVALAGAIIGATLPTGGWHEVYRAR